MVHKLVQNSHPFVVLRGNTYYFRYVIPTHIRKLCPSLPTEAKRSLHTDSFSEAVYLASQKSHLIKLLRRCQDAIQIKALWKQLVDFSGQVKAWVGRQIDKLSPSPVQSECAPLVPVEPEVHPAKPKTPTLSQAWDKFVSWKSWNEKRTKDNQRVFENLLFFIGGVPVGEITKADLKAALVSVAGLPQRNKKRYKGVPLEKLTAMKIPEVHLVSGKLVKEHLKLSQSLFNAYLVREMDILQSSPTEGLRWEHDDHRYASLTDAQVREVICRSENKPVWMQWFLLIAVYSGTRRSEIASLRPCDFKQCPDTDRYYFVISEGKTKAARRLVPVHRKLEEAGLMKWIGSGRKQIFPTAANNLNRVTDTFNSLVDERFNDLGERIVFHSTRHTFITKTRAAGMTNVLVQQVIGHEKSGAGMTDRYAHTFQLKDVLPVVDSIDYG